jgi:uncharacterized protein YcbX
MKPIKILSPEEMRKARSNQPRVCLEELRQREEEHKQASEEYFKAARNGTLRSGQKSKVSG